MAIIYGTNPVLEALNTEPGRIEQLIMLKGPMHGPLGRIGRVARERNIRITYLDRKSLNRKADSTSHQGIVAILSEFKYSTLDDLIKQEMPRRRIVVLDGVQDPHNLGAIIRTVVCAGALGVVIPERNAVGVTAAVSKSSAGALSKVKVVQVRNIAQTIDTLKEKGFWTVGIDASGKETVTEIDSSRDLALVMGNEGKGIRRLVLDKCDFTARIPMRGDFDSLNVSVATGVVLFTLDTE